MHGHLLRKLVAKGQQQMKLYLYLVSLGVVLLQNLYSYSVVTSEDSDVFF